MKASGFVADALKRHGIQGAIVAPSRLARAERGEPILLTLDRATCAGTIFKASGPQVAGGSCGRSLSAQSCRPET
jgi:hypothetical protein